MKKIFPLFCLFLLTFSFVACSSEKSLTPNEVVTDWWTAIQNADSEKASSYWSSEEAEEMFFDFPDLGILEGSNVNNDFINAYKKSFTLTVEGEPVTEDGVATVTTKISKPDFSNVSDDPNFYVEYMNAFAASNSDDIGALLIKYLETAPKTESTCTFTLTEVDGAWKINDYATE